MYESLSWLLPITLIVIAVAGYAFNTGFIIDAADRIEKRKARSKFGPALAMTPRERACTRFVVGGKMNTSELTSALDGLVEYARRLEPNWIVGLHTGGRLLSVYLADVLDIPPERCVFLGTEKSRNRDLVFQPDPSHVRNLVDGNMLVVDDISRTGNTLRDVESFLESRIYSGKFEVSSISFAVLAQVVNSDGTGNLFEPQWLASRSTSEYLKLPWSELSARIRSAYSAKHRERDYDAWAIQEHERIVSDFHYAKSVFLQFIEEALGPGFWHKGRSQQVGLVRATIKRVSGARVAH